MKTRAPDETPATVPPRARHAGEVRARWAWTEPAIWTERMLTALELGGKGGKWYSLMDKVSALPSLRAAWAKVKVNNGAAGVDHQTVAMFGHHLEANLEKLATELKAGTYRPRPVRRHWILKPGRRTEQRPVGIPCVRDRVVQAGLCLVLEPIFERGFAAQSYGFRPERGCKAALRRVVELLKGGHTFVVDADLQSYFDTIPQAGLLQRVGAQVSDGRVLELLEAFLKQGVMEHGKHWVPEAGTPQGGVLSPLLSNISLDPLDHHMAAEGHEMVRYADDFVVLCRSQAEADRVLGQVQQWTAAAGLSLHPEKTHSVDATQPGGFDFLGYHFEQGHRWPRKKSLRQLKDAIRAKTQRTNGHSLETIIANVNRTTEGWFEYFKHSQPRIFPPLDGWIRMRLRSILRKRTGRKGRGRGWDHQRWPNVFFATQGLYSLTTAYALACQSSRR